MTLKPYLSLTKIILKKIVESCINIFEFTREESLKTTLKLKILKTDSVLSYKNSSIEICSVTSHNDYIFLLLGLKTFIKHSDLKVKVLIFDDGTLLEKDCRDIKNHIVESKIIRKTEYDKTVLETFGEEHIISKKKDIVYVIKKIGPFLFSNSNKIIFLDSDVLFFKHPKEIIPWINDEYDAFYIKDCQDAYFFSQVESKYFFKTELAPQVNSGFLGINKKDFDIKIFEKVLKLHDKLSVYRPWQFQTFFAIILASKKCLILPKTYLISEELNIDKKTACCHYVRSIRNKLYLDGFIAIKKLQ